MNGLALLGVVGAVSIVLVLIALSLYDRTSRKCKELSLLRLGRSIDWREALDRLCKGNGYLVENHSMLPGRLLWVPSDPHGEVDTYEMITSDGLIVKSISLQRAREEVHAAGADDRYKQFVDGFRD